MYQVIPNTILTIANVFFCIGIADTFIKLDNKGKFISPLLVIYIIKSLFTTYIVYGDSIQFMIFSVFNSVLLIFAFIMFFSTMDDYDELREKLKKLKIKLEN